MPLPEQPDYNPYIIGFTENQGPTVISLMEAKERYGKLPSDFKLVSPKRGRRQKKVLNLSLGRRITEKLNSKGFNFKSLIYQFFQQWHRDWPQEFGVLPDPFFNLNHPEQIAAIMAKCQAVLTPVSFTELRANLLSMGLVRKDILNSIPDSDLRPTTQRILEKKLPSLRDESKIHNLKVILTRIRTQYILDQLRRTIGVDPAQADMQTITIYADEIAAALAEIAAFHEIPGVEDLFVLRGTGIEFQYAPRDISYLILGKETGDCTADKTPFQADRSIENIYWTVFPWLLDRNYQILKVYFEGTFVMKAHLLPLYQYHQQQSRIFLAVDAVETIRAIRDDLPDFCRQDLLGHREEIIRATFQQIRRIAGAMGIENIYAEKFSNTGWVRDYLSRLPEIYLHVNNLIKLDELEDIFCLAQTIHGNKTGLPLQDIFMEIQMKNTSLLPSVSKRNDAVKSFAVILGDGKGGIPMKKIIGI